MQARAPISEAELIEIEQRMRGIETYVADNFYGWKGIDTPRIEVCKSGIQQFEDVMADMRRLIDQARKRGGT